MTRRAALVAAIVAAGYGALAATLYLVGELIQRIGGQA